MVKPIPQGFHTVSPFFMAADPDKLVKFMQQALGAEVASVLKAKDGKIWHAQVKIGNSMVLVGDTMGKPGDPMNIYICILKMLMKLISAHWMRGRNLSCRQLTSFMATATPG